MHKLINLIQERIHHVVVRSGTNKAIKIILMYNQYKKKLDQILETSIRWNSLHSIKSNQLENLANIAIDNLNNYQSIFS